MDIPRNLRQEVTRAVKRSLAPQLEARGLLLSHDELASATIENVRSGETLLHHLIEVGYADQRKSQRCVQFEDDQAAVRIGLGLAYGSVTGALLAPPRTSGEQTHAIDLSCAMFNLGAGLIDGLCDGTPPLGLEFLRIVQGLDLAGSTRDQWPADRVRSALPAPLSTDLTVAFTARIIDGFLGLLCVGHPGDAGAALRERIGALLSEALEAENHSVQGRPQPATRDQLIEYSRQTSVLPFQVIEHLATGDPVITAPTAGTLLGEAIWRIDDLVDLAQDADDGSLNAVLLATADEPWSSSSCDSVAKLERVIASDAIAHTASAAAELLEAGLAAASERNPDSATRQRFLSFVHHCAGLAPRI
ncbi:hypothetical protein ACIRP3_43245 [Streptomyces sp. NPDC101209]|uniref:hypothetical protein n=1 Tax=Streptomyces sp. NPDC101209 TaxID=3366129 RepID=UPI0037F436B0